LSIIILVIFMARSNFSFMPPSFVWALLIIEDFFHAPQCCLDTFIIEDFFMPVRVVWALLIIKDFFALAP
jgi:hypothetical protein